MARGRKLRKVKAAVNQEHGKGALGTASGIMEMPRLSTGSISMDRALGGGFPGGRTAVIRGCESSGKTATVYRTMGLAQGLCANCYRPVEDLEVVQEDGEWVAKGTCDCYAGGLYDARQYPDENKDDYKKRIKRYETNSFEEFRVALIDPERAWDPEWGARLGIDHRRLLYNCPASAEEAGDVYDEILRTGEVDLIALDSIAAMTPSVEIVESLEKWQQGLQARILGKFARKVQSSVNVVVRETGRLPTQLWINQERQKIGVTFGDNTVMPAGVAQLFAASVIVKMWPSKWQRDIRDAEMIEELRTDIGVRVRINFKITKNKTAPAMQTGSYNLFTAGDHAGDIDEFKYFMAMAEKFGLVRIEGEKSKKRWFVGKEEYKTKAAMIERVQEPATHALMRKMLMDGLLVT